MGPDSIPGLVAVVGVTLVTLAIGTWGLRFSRTTSDFFVASRTVRPGLNATAIGGEYLSAASFLGIAGLLVVGGAQMLWYPVGWTAGYLLLLVLVAAPLRRSGAYTLPDFAEARLGSRTVRAACSLLVVAIGWLYLIPQFEGAGITLRTATGAPEWAGPVVVGAVVLANVTSGGMRSVTFVQAFQYWLKLTALLVPAAVLLAVWWGDGRPGAATTGAEAWSVPVAGSGSVGLYTTYSLMLGLFLGTMGLPHVVVRYYTNPDGRAARRTTVVVLALLGLFYLWPPVYAALGRVYGASILAEGRSDVLVLELPRLMVGGVGGDVLTGLVTAGAFAAFLSTASGLAIAVAGVITQDATSRLVGERRGGGVTAFRLAAVVAVTVPVLTALAVRDVGVAQAVSQAFSVAASTFAPLLVLGIWWRRLTDVGALAGLAAGGLGAGSAAVLTLAGVAPAGWAGALLAQPAAWSVPLAAAVMVVASLATRDREPGHAGRFLVRLHTPESLDPAAR
ncbi:cation acetate symporter [Nocardioides sp. zg-536]|uniref:Cation acetate symporter n=1 Tax=Nocardioides faecalis TaxID=2803858 RepID=A0A938Y8I3_9ACTN|nr:cation acetate symporter [Nocardioides faecalis]MBM9461137.1 cation acetate symporter [Nocardioides faecalis]QVI58992.1 cation acetate symporter [Nocardioides faecalis]